MKLVVREEYLEVLGLVVATTALVAVTGAGAGATHLIAIGLGALRLLWLLRFADYSKL